LPGAMGELVGAQVVYSTRAGTSTSRGAARAGTS
jgi:hypothetical protein